MRPFMDEDFLLCGPTAGRLYHEYAAAMPIVDYHCHVSPREIAQDVRFENLTQLWLGGDHYKWRIVRAMGAPEREITGESDDWTKFFRFTQALPFAAGNPVYHWAHLELRRYFDCDTVLNPGSARAVWEHCNSRLGPKGLSARGLIEMSGVRAICTTDDPADDLRWHRKLAEDGSFSCGVYPAFRPDRALRIGREGFGGYIGELSAAAGVPIQGLEGLFEALSRRMDAFERAGCRTADHGLDGIPYREAGAKAADGVLRRALRGEAVAADEEEGYQTELLLFLGREYARRDWAMQLHYGAIRNANSRMSRLLGPDTGCDCIGGADNSRRLIRLLDALERTGELPKTILFSLNPADNALLVSMAGCFPGEGTLGRVQHGAAWWFNDSREGMEAQLKTLASMGVLGGFIGMLTDSRSFLSYTRHEYFRRVLCSLLGRWVEAGEYPADIPALGELVQNISFKNAAHYLRLEV